MTSLVPGRPDLVVIRTTPLAAREPYTAAAAAPLRICRSSMSAGFRSCTRFAMAVPAVEASIRLVELSTGSPSMTKSGWFEPRSEFAPRMRM